MIDYFCSWRSPLPTDFSSSQALTHLPAIYKQPWRCWWTDSCVFDCTWNSAGRKISRNGHLCFWDIPGECAACVFGYKHHPADGKAAFSASLLQSSVTHDLLEIIQTCWLSAQETFIIIIINVENSYWLIFFWKMWDTFFRIFDDHKEH